MHTITLQDKSYPLLAFDTETTGIDPFSDHILTYGLSSEENPEFEEMLKLPSSVKELSEDNVAVHGYSLDHINKNGVDRKAGLISIFTHLDTFCTTTDGFIVGHNLAYDMTILYNEFMREGMTTEAQQISSWRIIDTFPILESSSILGMFKVSLKLNIIAETLGVQKDLLENAHNAGADSLVSIALLHQMMKFFPHLSSYSPDELTDFVTKSALVNQNRKNMIFKEDTKGFPVLFHKKNPRSAVTKDVEEKKGAKKRSSAQRKRKPKTSVVRKSSSSSSRLSRY